MYKRQARHGSNPTGRVVRPAKQELRLLHYKYLGADYLLERHAQLNARRRERDVSAGWGFHYDPTTTLEHFEDYKRRREVVVPPPGPPLTRWQKLFGRPRRARNNAAQRNS